MTDPQCEQYNASSYRGRGVARQRESVAGSSSSTATGKVRTFRTSTVGGSQSQKTYDVGKVLGNGSFGVVCEAWCMENGVKVAIKKVLQDPRYKNRELDIMKELMHTNIVELLDYFYTDFTDRDGNEHNRFLNVVMEHVPETVYRVMKSYVRVHQPMPMLLVKLYTYQMCRALGYLHSLGLCHRDIKPQNLLVDTCNHILKLCDFGSAKRLMPGEQSVAYICSRFYRAPELMLGATEYTTAIDIWSIGCVLGELLLGRPLFAGETSVDQLVKIIQVLGTPTRKQMSAMNPNYTEFRFPDVRPRDWRQVFPTSTPDSAIDLLSKFLHYEPGERMNPLEGLAHEFFDELREQSTRIPNGAHLPADLFLFSESELRQMSAAARAIAQPEWAKASMNHSNNSS